MDKILVVGLGVFGYNTAVKLMERGAEVVAVDRRMELIDEIQDKVTAAMCLDSTDEKALSSLGLENYHAGVVCIGENFEANLLTAVSLKSGRVKRVIARAATPTHARILRAVGIDEVITPGLEAASRLAYRLMHPGLLDVVTIDETISVAKVAVPDGFAGKSIGKLNLRARFGVNVIAVKRREGAQWTNMGPEQTISNPGADTVIHEKDVLVVIGDTASLEKLGGN